MTQIQKPIEEFQDYRPGVMIEGYLEIRALFENNPRENCWTEVWEDGETLIFPGWRFVNRAGCYLTEVPRSTPEEADLVFFAQDEIDDEEDES